jgi:hypothetical protein
LELIRRLAEGSHPVKMIEHGQTDNIFYGKIPARLERCQESGLLPLQAS